LQVQFSLVVRHNAIYSCAFAFFIAQYNATAGQRLLLPHRDGSVFSFNVALNDDGEYDGGGTIFRQLGGGTSDACASALSGFETSLASSKETVSAAEGGVVRSPKGHLLAHASALMHGGHAISSGCRYVHLKKNLHSTHNFELRISITNWRTLGTYW
jgi:hypothetical protein